MATSNEAQDVVRCKYCQYSAAQYYCRNCGDEICLTCQRSHKEDRFFSNHVIVPYIERETAGIRCRDHPNHFFDKGCQTCGIPICPECKIRSHFEHKDTDITTVCKKAKLKIHKGLIDMQNQERYLDNNMTNGTWHDQFHDFKQVKKNLQDRAIEMKTCIDNYLRESIQEVEKHECNYQAGVEKYTGEVSKNLREKMNGCKNNLEKLDPIELTFYLHKNPNWNYVSQPHAIQGLQIVHFDPHTFNKSEIERLFGTLTFAERTCYIGQIFKNAKNKRPKTAAPNLQHVEYFSDHHQEVSKTERRIPGQRILKTFHSNDNMKRLKMGLLETPSLLKEFGNTTNFLFQIAYNEQLSSVFISGNKSEIYTYQNVFKAREEDPKYETLIVGCEVQGLAIGLNKQLLYSDTQYGVIEISRNVIFANRNRMKINIGRNARVIFNKKDYDLWGLHCTLSGSYLICAIPYEQGYKNASVIRISHDGTVENEFAYNHRSEPLFSKPYFVCENRSNQNICVSDMEMKLIVLTSSGEVRFNYRGVKSVGRTATFYPRGIGCDGRGNILVADVGNDVVHLLKSNGEFVTHVLSSISPVSQPWGICVDSQDRVWVVERNYNEGEVKTFAKVKVFQIYDSD